MTELLINGYQVVLPKDFACTVKTENPILTKNGEYTYDITLSLGNDANKRVFGHLDRINNSSITTEWPAVMIVNNEVLLNGRAILVSNTDKEVSIQLVSGNSELNFLIGADKLISSLDLGQVNDLNSTTANASLDGSWPSWNYVIAPIYNGRIINSYAVDLQKPEWTTKDLIVQPYMGYYLEAIPRALGYEIQDNALRGDRFMSMLYILNVSSSRHFKDYLPGWTAANFLSEAEKYLNVVFVVNKEDKSIRILNCADIISVSPLKSIIRSVDQYKVDISEEVTEEVSINYESVGYDFPNTNYYKFMAIDKSIYNNVVSVTMPTFDALQEQYGKNFASYYNKNYIFTAGHSETEYVIDKDSSGSYYFRRVNLFCAVGTTSDDEEPTNLFKIIPAEIIVNKINYSLGDMAMFGYMQYPISTLTKDDSGLEEQGLIDKINSGASKESVGGNNIECALYYGRYYIMTRDGNYAVPSKRYPLSITDSLLEIVTTKELSIPVDDLEKANYTFRLKGLSGRFRKIYSKNAAIDVNRKFEISFPVENILDPRSIFIIKNKSFLCKEIEYEVTPNGFGVLAKGIFYPYELPAQVREWILKDYTWNDAGKWDDNQPWQDIDPNLNWTLNEGFWNDISLFSEEGKWNDNIQTT